MNFLVYFNPRESRHFYVTNGEPPLIQVLTTHPTNLPTNQIGRDLSNSLSYNIKDM